MSHPEPPAGGAGGGDGFAAAAADVLTANGVVCVVSDGPLPTPAVSYLTVSKFGLEMLMPCALADTARPVR